MQCIMLLLFAASSSLPLLRGCSGPRRAGCYRFGLLLLLFRPAARRSRRFGARRRYCFVPCVLLLALLLLRRPRRRRRPCRRPRRGALRGAIYIRVRIALRSAVPIDLKTQAIWQRLNRRAQHTGRVGVTPPPTAPADSSTPGVWQASRRRACVAVWNKPQHTSRALQAAAKQRRPRYCCCNSAGVA